MPKSPRKTAVERELEAQIEDVNRIHAELQKQRIQLENRILDNRQFANMITNRLEILRNARAPK